MFPQNTTMNPNKNGSFSPSARSAMADSSRDRSALRSAQTNAVKN